jgi:5-hydroxyisourate hydrolase
MMHDQSTPAAASILPRRGVLRAGLLIGGSGLATRLATAAEGADGVNKAPAGAAANTAPTPSPSAPSAPAGLTAAPTSMAGVSPRLTVHAIDTYHGATGPGLKIDLSRFEGGRWQLIKTVEANAGGRPADPLLADGSYRKGRYEVLLHLDDYFAKMGAKLPQPSFLAKVPLRFVVNDENQRVHLAALFSPWAYSYYRGS